MATSITEMKKVPAGTPTKVFTTGATESASMKFAVFGQASTANVDIKILPSSYTIPQDRFDATNFSKTPYPAGPIDTTWTYISGEVVGGTTYNYLMSPSQTLVRFRNSSTNYFDAAVALDLNKLYRYTDNQRGIYYDYTAPSGTLTVKSHTAGAMNKFTDVNALTTVFTRSGWNYYGAYAWSDGSATGRAFTFPSADGSFTSYSYTSNVSTTAPNDFIYYSSGSPEYYFYSNWGGGTYQKRYFTIGNYTWIFGKFSSVGWEYYSVNSNTNITNGSTWSTPNIGISIHGQLGVWTGTDRMRSSGYSWHTVDFMGKVFLLFTSSSYTEAGSGDTGALKNQILSRTVPNGTDGSITYAGKWHPTPGTYGYTVDGTFAPVILTSPDRIVYKCGAAAGQTRYFSIDTAGTTADYGATTPQIGTPLSFPYNAKTLAVNYANYNQYKFTNGISDSDGLAYYTDGTGSYNTNGQSFWTKDGKYTLIRDESMKKLDVVSTDDYWFDRQVSMATGVRKEYTGITLAPGQSFWVTGDKDINTIVFGFKE